MLVVEDDPINLRYLTVILRQEGYDVETASDGEDAIAATERTRPDVILLDLGLPDLSGIEVCLRIRRHTSAPIIVLTGRSAEVDRVIALDAGADDYVVKPAGVNELLARIRAVLRRARGFGGAPSTILDAGGVVVDTAARRVYVHGREVRLPPKEFDLLRFLMTHCGRVIDRQRIIGAVWGSEFMGDPSTLDVHVRRLRRKIEQHPDQPELIRTVHGVGYRFAGSEDGANAANGPARSAS